MDNWRKQLIENPPYAASQYSADEWKHIVLNELICDPHNESWIGESNPFYGKTHSDETLRLMSQIKKEYFNGLTPEERKQIHGNPGELNGMYGWDRSKEKNPMYGRKHSESTRQKISRKASERIVSDNARKSMSLAQKKRWTAEERKIQSEKCKARGHKPPSSKGMLWWNNGTEVKRAKSCPGPGWVRGRKLE